jgi:multiple sugar transport system substrate-binding protein
MSFIERITGGKNMKKNVLALLLAAVAVAGLTGCNKTTSTASSTGTSTGTSSGTSTAASTATSTSTSAEDPTKDVAAGDVINIRCWNNEFEGRFANYYDKIDKKINDDVYKLKDGKYVKFIIVANDNNAYQNALDAALTADATAKANDKTDMFLMEADYAIKYANSDYSLDVKGDLGLTNDDMAQMYDYTKTVVTDTRAGKNNALKGVSWQATPGLYAFRTDIAKDIWGSEYPADPVASDTATEKASKTAAQAAFVQSKISDWTKFDAVARVAKAKNHYMLSGYDDAYRVYSNNATSPWVNPTTNKITLDPQYKSWVKATDAYTKAGYSHKTTLWSSDWSKDQGPTGNSVFGFFYSTWGINFTLEGNSLATSTKAGGKEELGNGLYGLYRVCQGPASWYWGGTWLAGAKETDNKDDVKDIMKVMTCDKAIAKKITIDTSDYTNNKAAMDEIANDADYGSSFLGGQNHIKLFQASASNIKLAAMSAYDQGCNEGFQNAMHDYFAGKVTYAHAIANYKTTVEEKYADLTDEDFDSSFDTL